MPAPIVLFTYNRLEHTRRTVESLSANDLSRESDLLVFSDGPKAKAEIRTVSAVRDYLSTIDGFKNVTLVARDRNFGLADSIVDGVTSTLENHGQVIVLEDDLELSPYFLQFMNHALSYYKHEERVMHIAGYMLPIPKDDLPPSFFLRQSTCWGWGTWSRAWRHFSREPEVFAGFSHDDINRFNLDGAIDYWGQAKANIEGKLKTWAVYWYASVFRQQGLCLHPRSSLVNNIGHDGSGTNCGRNELFGTSLAQERLDIFPNTVYECELAMRRFKEVLRGGQPKQPRTGTRIANWFARIMRCFETFQSQR